MVMRAIYSGPTTRIAVQRAEVDLGGLGAAEPRFRETRCSGWNTSLRHGASGARTVFTSRGNRALAHPSQRDVRLLAVSRGRFDDAAHLAMQPVHPRIRMRPPI